VSVIVVVVMVVAVVAVAVDTHAFTRLTFGTALLAGLNKN